MAVTARETSNATVRRIHAAARAASEELLEKKNVRFVTIGHKRVKGVLTGEPSINVYVSKKEDVEEPHRIPATFQSLARGRTGRPIKSDVIELRSAPTTFGVRAGNVLIASDKNVGVCGLSFTKNRVGYVLTNAHVGCDIPHGGRPCTLNLLDPFSKELFLIGPVIWSSGLSQDTVAVNDSAVARADYTPVDAYKIFNIEQQLSGTSHFVFNNTTYWFSWNGVEFECAHPEKVVHPTEIDVEGVTIKYDGFWILHMTRGASAPGQSGALICRTDNNTTVIGCGLVFGGSAPDLIFAFSFDDVLEQAYAALP